MISIIIPARNEEKHIGNLLDSLASQNFLEEIEVIVADANSTDKTREVAESFSDKFSQFKIIEGGTPAISRNNGAKASSGDPIFFIDADVIASSQDFLRIAVEHFRKKNLAIASSYLKPRSKKWRDHFLVGAYNVIMTLAKFIRPLGAMHIVASRDAFNKSGGYPEDVVMNEDHDFVLTCAKYGLYDIIPIKAIFSVRRFEKEGRMMLVLKYLKAAAYRQFFGPTKKPIFKYEFEYSEKEDEAYLSKIKK